MDKFTDRIYVFSSIGIILIMVFTSMIFAVNIPYFDDYNLVLEFLTDYHQADSFAEKISLICEPRNGHRIIFFKILTLTTSSIFGSVNFIHLILLSNLGWFMAMLLVLGRALEEVDLRKQQLLITMLMAVPAWAILNWSSSGLTGVWMLFFSLVSLYSLSRPQKNSFVLGVVFAVLASFTFGGGLLVYIAAVPVILGRGKQQMLIWTMMFIICVTGYLWDNSSGTDNGSTFSFLLMNPHIVAANTLLFFGAPFKVVYGDQHFWSLLFGLIVLSWGIFLLFQQRLRTKNPLRYSCLLFFLMLGILTALMRSHFGLGATTSYRYRFFQIMPIVFVYLGSLDLYPVVIKRLMPVLLAFVFLFFGLRYFDNLEHLKFQKRKLEMGLLSYQLTGNADQLTFRIPSQAGPIYERALASGVYDPPDWTSFYQPLGQLKPPSDEIPIRLIINEKFENDRAIELRGWVFPEYRMFGDLQIMGVVSTDNHQLLVPTGPYTHPSALIDQNPVAFVLTVPKVFFKDTVKVEGIALYHPLRGAVGVKMMPE